MESLERLHLGVQAARTDPAVPGYSQAGRIPGGVVSNSRLLLGQVVATPGALTALPEAGQTPQEFISRHEMGGWGDLDEGDRRENERSLEDGCRLLSAYHLRDGTKIWIITEADRSATTLLLQSEY